MRALVTAGIVKSEKGKNGGFALTRPPLDVTLYDVMTATEGKFAPVLCIKNHEACIQFDTCGVKDAWLSLGKTVSDHLKSINFQDMIDKQKVRQQEGAAEKEDWNYY